MTATTSSPAAAATTSSSGGAGDDTFIWNPGDGSDTIEGQSGNDTLLFNGANVNEKVDITANGSRVRFTRDVANIVMDVNGVENINFNALGGADTITVGDLTGTDVKQVNIDLGGSRQRRRRRGRYGDPQRHRQGRQDQGDHRTATNVTVTGLAETVNILGTDTGDALTIQSGAATTPSMPPASRRESWL